MTLAGHNGDIVVMRPDIYQAMLGLSDEDEAETVASVHRGLADLKAGRVQDFGRSF